MVTTELLCTSDNMLALIPSSYTALGKLPLSLQDMSSKPKFWLIMMMHMLAKINAFRCFTKHQQDLYRKIRLQVILFQIQMNDTRHPKMNTYTCILIHGFSVCIFLSHPKLKWEWGMELNTDYFSLSTC